MGEQRQLGRIADSCANNVSDREKPWAKAVNSKGGCYHECLLRQIANARSQSQHQLLPAVSPTPTSFSTPTPSDPPSPKS